MNLLVLVFWSYEYIKFYCYGRFPNGKSGTKFPFILWSIMSFENQHHSLDNKILPSLLYSLKQHRLFFFVCEPLIKVVSSCLLCALVFITNWTARDCIGWWLCFYGGSLSVLQDQVCRRNSVWTNEQHSSMVSLSVPDWTLLIDGYDQEA